MSEILARGPITCGMATAELFDYGERRLSLCSVLSLPGCSKRRSCRRTHAALHCWLPAFSACWVPWAGHCVALTTTRTDAQQPAMIFMQ